MIYEIAIQTVDTSRRDEYIRVFGQALKDANFAGAHDIRIFSSVENPNRIVVMIAWDSVEAHTQHRGTPAHTRMREIASQYQTGKSDGGHYLEHKVQD